MKQQFLYAILLSTFLTSCEKIFHEPETSIGKIENYDQLVEAAEGTWGKLAWAVNYPDPLSFYFQNLKADDITFGSAVYGSYYPDDPMHCFGNLLVEKIFEYNKYPGYLYESLYRVIASANNILVQYPDPIGEEDPVKEILGEMLLLRAYCHYRLTRTYGQIAIIKDIDVNFDVDKPSFVQIYEFIETDLIRAKTLLPETSQVARIFGKRPGKGAAKAILAEVYLSWAGFPVSDVEKYSSAAKEAGELIDSADYYGFELLSDFADLWETENSLNRETILCLFFTENENVTTLDQINLLYSQSNSFQRLYPDFRTAPYSDFTNSSFYASEVFFFNHYPPGYRKDITFFTDFYVPPSYYEEYHADTGYIHVDSLDVCDRAGYRKFYKEEGRNLFYDEYLQLNDWDTIHGGGEWWYITNLYLDNSQIYLYRFAHTLLTYAEAKARSGQLDVSAYEAVNRIRRRANNVDQYTPSQYDLTPGLPASVFADSVVWERAWELAGEPEGRYFDLLRLEKLEELPNYRHPEEMSPPWKAITREEYFLPIPEEDIMLNPNFGK